MPDGLLERAKPRKQPRQARARATVDAIVTATAQVLLNEGWAGVTTNRIAERAGTSIGTLYQYFGNKEALIGAVIDREFDRFVARLQGYLDFDADATLEQAVAVYVDATLVIHKERAPLFKVLAERLRTAGWYELETLWLARIVPLVELGLAAQPQLLGGRPPGPLAFAVTHAVHTVLLRAVLDQTALLDSPAFASSLSGLILGCLRGA